jgi:hypothetical protein
VFTTKRSIKLYKWEGITLDMPTDLVSLLQSGGTPALVICTYFIYKLESRLARIEKAFDTFVAKFESQKS